jgi:probable HAF family extracellular repeat protein
MRTTILHCTIAMMLLTSVAVRAQFSAAVQPGSDHAPYRVYNLGTLGGSSSSGNTDNDLGWVMGIANITGDVAGHATLWAYGFKLDLGTLGGLNSSVSWPVKNNRGQIAGIAETAAVNPLGEEWSCNAFFPTPPTFHNCVGFVWQWGTKTALPTLGGYNGYAAGMNNAGQVAGWAETTYRDPTCVGYQVLQFLPVIYGPDTSRIQRLPTYPGDPDGSATDVNDEGDVVGISGICYQAVGSFSAAHALLWHDGNVINLGSLGGVAWNTPQAINNDDVVVGFSDLPGDQDGTPNFHAFVWTAQTGMKDLHTLPGDAISQAAGINDRGQIVGVSYAAGFANPRAVLWQNGTPINLNDLIPSDSNLDLLSANDINDEGEITGQACVLINSACTSESQTTAFLLVPNRDWDGAVTAQPTPASIVIAVPEKIRQQIIRRYGLAGR